MGWLTRGCRRPSFALPAVALWPAPEPPRWAAHSESSHYFFERIYTLLLKTPKQASEHMSYGVAVPRHDRDMQLAFQEAQRTLAAFIESLQNLAPTQTYFAVKIKLPDVSGAEYIWVRDVSFVDPIFIGELSSDPGEPSPYKLGDQYRVDKQNVYDWMIVDDGKLVGGYTIRVARRHMSDKSRQEFDQLLWFDPE